MSETAEEAYDDLPFRGVLQDMEPAFTGLKSYTLTVPEVEVVYLALAATSTRHAREHASLRKPSAGTPHATVSPSTA